MYKKTYTLLFLHILFYISKYIYKTSNYIDKKANIAAYIPQPI